MSGSNPSSRGSCHVWLLGGSSKAALLRGGKDRIVGVDRVDARGTEAAITRDALHPSGDESMTLARLDGMKGHPGGLHTGGAEAIDRGGWNAVQSKLHCDSARHIAALLITWLGTADVDVIQRAWVEALELCQCCGDHSCRKIIWAQLRERSLGGTSDRRTCGGDDDGLRSFDRGVRHHDHNPMSRPMSSFMISFEPAQILDPRASAQARATRYSFM